MAIDKDIKNLRNREYRHKNKERTNELRRKRYALKDPEERKKREKERYWRDKAAGKHKRGEKWRSLPGTKIYLQGYLKRWSERNPDYRTIRTLSQYGLTLDQYNALLKKQRSVCAICKKPETSWDKKQNILRKLAVDHHHETGAVRGLLCVNCNNGLGRFQDDLKTLRAAVRYIKRFNAPPATP